MSSEYVYVLVSLRDGRCYVGRSNNLLRRFRQHADGWVRSTRGRRPLVMVHWEVFPSKHAASIRERFLKSPASAELKTRFRRMAEQVL